MTSPWLLPIVILTVHALFDQSLDSRLLATDQTSEKNDQQQEKPRRVETMRMILIFDQETTVKKEEIRRAYDDIMDAHG